MPNFLLDIEYDGTDFAGWQVQSGLRTVQGELEKACRKLAGRPVRVIGAGRTDAGVHAAGQAASADIPWRHGTPGLVRALNANLSRDVAVSGARAVSARFDAQRDAVERCYRYAILRRGVRSPLLRRFALLAPYPLDLARMRKAAALFRGTHDFAAFCTEKARRRGSIRLLKKMDLRVRGGILTMDLAAPGFLHHMVRMIAGALLAVGRGRLHVGRIRRALAGERSRLAPTAPAHGLILLRVRYAGEPAQRLVSWPFAAFPGRGCNKPPACLVRAL